MTALALSCWPTARMDAGEAEYIKMERRRFTNGIHASATDNNKFRTFGDSTGMQAKVDTGSVNIQGVYGESLTLRTVGVATAHGTLDRIDRIVLRLDKTSPYTIYLDILTGTASSSPLEPTLTVSSTIVEIPLAKVLVGHGVSTIRVQDVIDERVFSIPRGTPGVVDDFAGSVPPEGAYICDGALKNRITDAALFAAIGTTWGSGDGSTTFQLPSLQDGRLVRGGAPGTYLGNDSITLTEGQLPTVTPGPGGSGGSTGFVFAQGGAQNNSIGGPWPANGSVGVTFTGIYPFGSGNAIDIRPKSATMN